MMMNLFYKDFRKICGEYNKRIYYFQAENILYLYFITDNIFVKSFVDLNIIDNKEKFFGSKMFIGATELMFNMPDDETRVSITSLPSVNIVEASMPIESEKKVDGSDVQQEGVEGI